MASFRVTTVRLSDETMDELEELTKRLQREKSDVMREALRIGIEEMKLKLALELYSKGRISFGRTMEMTGLGYRKLASELKSRGIAFRYGEERFREEAQNMVG